MGQNPSEYNVGKVVIAGRKYLTLELVMRPKKAGAKGKTYLQYVVTIPKPVALELYKMIGEKPDTVLTLIAYLSPAPWYTGLLWKGNEETYRSLPGDVKKELVALGISPEADDEVVLVVARKKQLEELGLDVSRVVTLDDILERLGRKLMVY